MRLKQLENQWRVYLHPMDYHRLWACAESRRAFIAIRLGGDCGLRVNETANFKLNQVREATVDFMDDAHFLTVYGKDTTGRFDVGKHRETYIPRQLYHLIKKHAREEGIGPDEDIIPVTKRTTQEYIKRAAKACAERYGDERYSYISSHDLRAYWASSLLVRHKVDENVVMSLGGWTSRENMEPYINASFDDLILRELDDADLL